MTDGLVRRAVSALEDRWDPARSLVRWVDDPPMYWAFPTLSLAQGWQQTDPERFTAEWPDLIRSVLASQVTAPDDPFEGNFTWLVDDAGPEDPNAVVFVLRPLLPILHRDRRALDAVPELEPALLAAGEAIERIDLGARYTNIAICGASCMILIDDLLGRPIDRGFERLMDVVHDVVEGAPTEFNSPSYVWHAVAPLLLVREHASDEQASAIADVLAERLTVHAAERFHEPTRAHLGPHSRCYVPELWSHQGITAEYLKLATGIDWLPDIDPGSFAAVEMSLLAPLADWPTIVPAIDARAGVVWETSNAEDGTDVYTHLADGWGMGTASRQFHAGVGNLFVEGEMNNWLVHYVTEGGTELVTSRYVDNDRHIGELGPAPDRPSDASYYEQGRFVGFQHENRTLMVYGIEPSDLRRTSSKAVLAFTCGSGVASIQWADGEPQPLVAGLEPPFDAWIRIDHGDFSLRFRVLRSRSLGADTPDVLRVVERDGRIEIEAHLYLGPERTIWEVCEVGGVFWKDEPHIGVAIEVGADAPDAGTVSLDGGTSGGTLEWEHATGPTMVLGFDGDTLEPLGRRLGGDRVEVPSALGQVFSQVVVGDEHTPVWVYRTRSSTSLVSPRGTVVLDGTIHPDLSGVELGWASRTVT